MGERAEGERAGMAAAGGAKWQSRVQSLYIYGGAHVRLIEEAQSAGRCAAVDRRSCNPRGHANIVPLKTAPYHAELISPSETSPTMEAVEATKF